MDRGKKKEEREYSKLVEDAKEKKDKLMQAQSQVKDSEVIAKQTRQEADRLNREAEEAEMAAASAASREHARNQESHQTQVKTSYGYLPQSYTNASGQYAYQEAQSEANQGSYSFQQAQQYQNYTQPPSSEYNSVMGGGGIEIPTPKDDPYGNPFE